MHTEATKPAAPNTAILIFLAIVILLIKNCADMPEKAYRRFCLRLGYCNYTLKSLCTPLMALTIVSRVKGRS